MMTKRTKGFTLVEILIVVIILGILAAIIIPQFTDASESARDSSIQSNLQAMRAQFELYKAQHNDMYPWEAADGSFESDAETIRRLTTKTDAAGAAGGNLGPYMQNVPTNPRAENVDVVFADSDTAAPSAANPTCHWIIDADTGAILDATAEAAAAEEEPAQ